MGLGLGFEDLYGERGSDAFIRHLALGGVGRAIVRRGVDRTRRGPKVSGICVVTQVVCEEGCMHKNTQIWVSFF
jgi:hypothetical protein